MTPPLSSPLPRCVKETTEISHHSSLGYIWVQGQPGVRCVGVVVEVVVYLWKLQKATLSSVGLEGGYVGANYLYF